MSYLRHWKLRSTPFRTPQSYRDVFLGGTVQEALARAEFLVGQRKRLGLVVGPNGVGKSILMRHFCQSRLFQTTNEHACMLSLFGQTPFDIVVQCLRQLDPESSPESSSLEQNILRISDLVMSCRTVGHHTIFVFDEADSLSESHLELFARLSRIPGVSAFLNVTEESLVDLPRWVFESAEMRLDLPAWDLGQLVDYFEFAIQNVGGNPEIFDGQSMTRIQELADGIPRKIIQIADLALVSGAVRRLPQIHADIIDEVCNEFTLTIGTNFPVFWEGQQLNA